MEKSIVEFLIELDKFKDYIFIEDGHKYIDTTTGEMLTSVTTKIKKYQEPFRSEYWATFKALQANGHMVFSDSSRGVPKNHIKLNNDSFLYTELLGRSNLFLVGTPSSIQEDWSYEANKGKVRGNLVHSYIENRWNNKIKLPTEDLSFIKTQDELNEFVASVKKCYKMVDKFFNENTHLIPINLEKVIGDRKLRIAGQIDAILFNKNTGKLHLYDYKTDKKFNTTNQYGSKFIKLLSKYDDCEFNKYSIQVAMYKAILEKNTNLTFGDSYSIWFYHENPTYKLIKLKPFKQEVKKILNDKV